MESKDGISTAGYYIAVYSECIRSGSFKGYAAGESLHQVTTLGIETDVYFTPFLIIGGVITIFNGKEFVFLQYYT